MRDFVVTKSVETSGKKNAETANSTKICDNKSVGMIVKNDEGKILLIERRKFPYGFAPPAGHLDGDTWEDGARRELKEEVGLTAKELRFLGEGKMHNPCRREGGSWHDWMIFGIEKASGQVERSLDETKRVGWYSPEQIALMGERTERYLAWEIPEDEWVEYPGLEPVWYRLFKEMRII